MHLNSDHSEIKHLVDGLNLEDYQQKRNFLGDNTTKLSPYITHGLLDLIALKDQTLNKFGSAAWHFAHQLTWREYFALSWYQHGENLLSGVQAGDQRPRVRVGSLPQNVLAADTGITALDASIRQLYEHGWIHNHARMWLASYVTNLCGCDWRTGADWMYYHLIDGDPASNHFSWQWVAGIFSHKKYLFNQDNINKFAPMYAQSDTILDCSYSEVAELQIDGDTGQHQTESFELRVKEVKELPICSLSEIADSQSTFVLHTPFTINLWRENQLDGKKHLLFFDLELFGKLNINQQRLDQIIVWAKNIEGIRLVVCRQSELKDFAGRLEVIAHPSLQQLSSIEDYPRLFSGIEWQGKSMSNYWRQIEKKHDLKKMA